MTKTTDAQYKIIVIDNGSDDTTPLYLNSIKSKIGLINNTHNLGYVCAINQGLELCLGHDTDIMFLNDDTIITDPLWLHRMQKKLHSGNDRAAIGPVSNFVGSAQHIKYNRRYKQREHTVQYLIGFCFLMKKETFDTVGYLDEQFNQPIGNDDLDYSLRIAENDMKMICDRETFVYHFGQVSTNKLGNAAYHDKQSRRNLVNKWGEQKVSNLFSDLINI